MGHHHRKRRNEETTQQRAPETANQNPLANMDLSSMLSSLNMDNVDLSKVDFSKVQSMFDKIKLPENNTDSKAENPRNMNDQRIALLNSIKPFLPPTRSKAMDNITKLFQIASIMGNTKTANH